MRAPHPTEEIGIDFECLGIQTLVDHHYQLHTFLWMGTISAGRWSDIILLLGMVLRYARESSKWGPIAQTFKQDVYTT